MLDRLAPVIAELDQAVTKEAEQRSDARRLMEQLGVGPVTALMFVLTIGPRNDSGAANRSSAISD
jgi:transposase